MLFTKDYLLVDGTHLVEQDMIYTPIGLLQLVRANPTGHVFEKWSNSMASSIQAQFGDRTFRIIERTELAKELDGHAFLDELKKIIDPAIQATSDQLLEAIKYFTNLKRSASQVRAMA